MARGARRPDRGDRDRRGGFALIEVMLALMLIAVLAALAMPGLARPAGPAAIRVAAFQVSALLREDRNVAQSGGVSVATGVDVNTRRIASGASSSVVTLPVGVAVRLMESASPNIRFFADGSSSGGAILIETAAIRYAVVVRRDTGAIRVSAP